MTSPEASVTARPMWTVHPSAARDSYVQVELLARMARLVYDGSAGQSRIGFRLVEFVGDSEGAYGRYIDYLIERSRRLR